jgi:YkoY family integral membrane protein
MLFGQTFEIHDLALIGLLVVLEGVLSIDNALVLGLLAKRVPKAFQKRALTYGLAGALIFRIVAIATAVWLMHWWFVKLIGGGYLVYIAAKHLFFEHKDEHDPHLSVNEQGEVVLIDPVTHQQLSDAAARDAVSHSHHGGDAAPAPTTATEVALAAPAAPAPAPAPRHRRKPAGFWPTVLVIELTDIAFAIDSILAAIALVGSAPPGTTGLHPKFWVVVTGGMLGVILMRVAAIMFIKMLDKFPRFETAAYLLVALIGAKLLVDWWFNKPPPGYPADKFYYGPVDFHSPGDPAFWVFWLGMLACFCVGFIPPKKRPAAGPA